MQHDFDTLTLEKETGTLELVGPAAAQSLEHLRNATLHQQQGFEIA